MRSGRTASRSQRKQDHIRLDQPQPLAALFSLMTICDFCIERAYKLGMRPSTLKRAIKSALVRDGDAILRHIRGLQDGRYTGIESEFEKALLRELGIQRNVRVTCRAIGSRNYFPGRSAGTVDLVLDEATGRVAFEFKAVRMPRKKADCCFDVSQLTSDYLRLARATKIDAGWIIAFVYGPLVVDSTNDRDLLTLFRNQMFVETRLSLESKRLQESCGRLHVQAARKMGWDNPLERALLTDVEFAVLVKMGDHALGAVCICAQ